MQKPVILFTSLVKTVMLASLPTLMVLTLYVVLGLFELSHFFFAYIGVLLSSIVIVYPFLISVNALTNYVNDLAQDKKVEAPNLSVLNTVEKLSEALKRFNRSWERKKQQMENIIIEREILVDTIPDILIMLDNDNRVVRTNRAARTIFGQNLAKKPLRDIIHNETMLGALYAVVEDMRGRQVEFRIEHPTPYDFRAIIERFPVPSTGGISTIITLTDITELKRGEQMRADFVANASHEIRTPLASIIGFIETIQGPAKDDPEAQVQFLKLMNDQAQRMSRLVQDLLTLSKVEVDVSKAPMDKVNLVKVVRREVQHFEWAAQQKKMNIRIDVRDELPAVKGEEGELAQVVHNLVGNAIKYGTAGTEVTVGIRLSSSLPSSAGMRSYERAVCLSVRDKGEGIPKEHIPRLTERFYRVDSARTRKVGGTGLGLAIVKHIITRHRGAMMIDSVVGKGSVFSVYLPLYEEG
ncbi:MAG: PAS domain-containing protein [Alphaproteobacteria bacterium]|nr:PAS domain-containing protein [Alphaproteobacteria bacterium]